MTQRMAKLFQCPFCGAAFTHAKAREHWEQCPKKSKR